MRTAQQIADRVQAVRTKNARRDQDYKKIIAIRKGDYDTVAPGMFSSDFDRPLVANLIDTTARDIAEVMAPLPAFNCSSASMSSDADRKRQDLRGAIANAYVQYSRLQDQMYGGADRYGSFGFMAYIVEPDFTEQMPIIRISTNPMAHYCQDYRGRTKEFFEVGLMTREQLVADFPEEVAGRLKDDYGRDSSPDRKYEVVRHYDDHATTVLLLEPKIVLARIPNRVGRCLVRVVERPSVTGEVRGQFDDVIWVQVARALVQQYTMDAIEQSVNAPVIVPDDVNEIEMGPYTVLRTKTPQGAGRMNLQLPQGVFPEQQILAQEQRTGSRYPEGRSGSVDASIITGQGVQALMGTFDTQVQTFQRLNASALEDVVEMCFRMDEALWGGVKKTCHIKDNGAPRRFEYTPSKDIAGNYVVDVGYGAIAGLDPNRGLVFVLQALAGGLLSKATARKSLPVDINPDAEEQQITLENLDGAVATTFTQLPLAIPQMAMMGQDPRELALQIAEVHKHLEKGLSPVDAMQKVFAPKEKPQPEQPLALPGPGGPAGAPASPGSDLLMMLSGLTPSGNANLSANVSSYREF